MCSSILGIWYIQDYISSIACLPNDNLFEVQEGSWVPFIFSCLVHFLFWFMLLLLSISDIINGTNFLNVAQRNRKQVLRKSTSTSMYCFSHPSQQYEFLPTKKSPSTRMQIHFQKISNRNNQSKGTFGLYKYFTLTI